MRGVCAALLAGAIVLAGAGGAAGSSPSAPTFAFTVSQVSAGESHTCAVTGADVLQCWGLGTDGQIGPTSAGRPFPTFVANGIRSVSAGFQHTCAVTTAGAAECFGANGSGQLGDGSTNPNANPHQVTSLGSGVRVVSAGRQHSCALTTAGGVECWGDNSHGELGATCATPCKTPVTVSGLSSGVIEVAAGNDDTCALLSSGTVDCWGFNFFGELGNSDTTHDAATPTPVAGLSGVKAIAVGYQHTCALTNAGAVKCWGENDQGELGDGGTCATPCTSPVQVTGLSAGVVAIAAGGDHTCGLLSSGAARCWGGDEFGTLGDAKGCAAGNPCYTPVPVAGLTDGVSISAGLNHTCVVTRDGSARCWGHNNQGQLGNTTLIDFPVPKGVDELSSVAAVNAGYEHTCTVTNVGEAECWGYNQYGQVGDRSANDRLTPAPVPNLSSGMAAISLGFGHTCVFAASQVVACWGYNAAGQLGDGSHGGFSLDPVLPSLGAVDGVAAGNNHTCALTYAGAVECWGDNNYGDLGDGTITERDSPVPVSGLSSGVTAIAAGASYMCALTSAGAVKCWGLNDAGQLGDGTKNESHVPVDVSGLSSGVAAISAGDRHTCAVLYTGGVKCWGSNTDGQLGDGKACDPTACTTPVDVSGMTNAIAVATGDAHSCALTSAGGVECWGYNATGQLGDGTMDEHDTPVAVTGLGSGMIGVAAGHIHSCAISATDRIKCWGDNARGQLGDGTTTRRLTPVEVVGFEDPRTVTVAKSGSGAGTVTSIPAGIACGTSCAHAFAFGTSVTLTATAAAGSVFTGWSGSCSGTGACIVTTDANRAVTATFKLLRTLSVQRAGTGSGRIVGSPGAIDCGATCSAAFADGTSVALTAIADAGSTFAGWSGSCSGTTTSCTVAMSGGRSATATFVPVSKPPGVHCVVPKVTGKTLAKARAAIAKAHCRVGKITRRFSAKKKRGRVLSERPRAGAKLANRAKVNLIVGKGPKPRKRRH